MIVYRKLLICLFLLTISFFSFGQNHFNKDGNKADKWFPKYDFKIASFKKPSLEFAPFARWWWPGNDVTKEELRREINLFADYDFGGVEVQPMNLAMPPISDSERKILTSWDGPAYYENLRAVMEEARNRGLIVDMTNGSGWPPASPNLTPEDGFISLEFSDTTVIGGNALFFTIPILPDSKNRTKRPPLLQAVVMARMLPEANGASKTILLDAASSKDISSYTNNGTLNYSFPEGEWKVIAFWAVPSGEQSNLAAFPKPMTIVDHLDSQKVLKLYNYLFGERTGLQPYFGSPMRAVFSDSYEFTVNRHYSLDFLSYFKKHRGYDITPYLPANMQKGYNYVAYMRPKAQPDFFFSNQDWRLRYDYDITISDLLADNFFKTSRNWAEKEGLLFRTQGYGMNMDMIAMAGLASIPETESMLGSEANLKVMTSGALLYNRPIVTAESVVFINRAYTTTPQKIKLAVDKLFAAGVNQIIYHGVPYRYTQEKLGLEGWYPFSSPIIGGINFSSNLGEGNIFWKDQKAVNEYVARVQSALRSGKPHADVLLYYPFLDVGEGTLNNEEEILTVGYLKDVEGPLPPKEEANPAKAVWAQKIYPLINQLEANGISWAWVNDESIHEAILEKDGQINIRGNHFQALILANDTIIQLQTAKQIKTLSNKGMNLLASGALPNKQPSFLNWKENDATTAEDIATALKSKNAHYINDERELAAWIKQLRRPVAFQQQFHFTRQAQRDMSDGSRIQFIWNKSDQWQSVSLSLGKIYRESYWLNADGGTVIKNHGSIITYSLPPYGSVILYAATKNIIMENALLATPISMNKTKEMISIGEWNIKADSIEIKNSPLFDWKTNEQFKFSSAQGIYTSSFQWNHPNSPAHIFIDLGKVYFTAEVYINDKLAGKRIFAPYLLDITPFLIQGVNKVEIHVTTGQLNGFIGRAKQGDNHYKQFKGKEDQLMSAGLIGPVVFRTIE